MDSRMTAIFNEYAEECVGRYYRPPSLVPVPSPDAKLCIGVAVLPNVVGYTVVIGFADGTCDRHQVE